MFSRSKLIVFVGADGSGKSTQINVLDSKLSGQIEVDLRRVRFNVLPRLGELLQFWRHLYAKSTETREHAEGYSNSQDIEKYIYGPPLPRWKIFICLSYEILDFMCGQLEIRLGRKEKIFIFDRYFYDYFSELDWAQNPKWFMKILMLFVPEPDYIIHLCNDAKVVRARKPELEEDEIAAVNERIFYLLCNKSNYHRINTTHSIAKTNEEICEVIGMQIATQ